jgi:hypothetical protein
MCLSVRKLQHALSVGGNLTSHVSLATVLISNEDKNPAYFAPPSCGLYLCPEMSYVCRIQITALQTRYKSSLQRGKGEATWSRRGFYKQRLHWYLGLHKWLHSRFATLFQSDKDLCTEDRNTRIYPLISICIFVFDILNYDTEQNPSRKTHILSDQLL